MIIDTRNLKKPTPKGCQGIKDYAIPSGLGELLNIFYNRFIPSGFSAQGDSINAVGLPYEIHKR